MSKRMYHPCHKLSVPSAKIFWCRHCMQMFEDAISRWRHSKSCRGSSGVRKEKDRDGRVIQMYVRPDKVSYTSNLTPGLQVINHKKQVKPTGAELRCIICAAKFACLDDMREHVKSPCTKQTIQDFPSDINKTESVLETEDNDPSVLKIRRVESDKEPITTTALSVLAEASKHVESLSNPFFVTQEVPSIPCNLFRNTYHQKESVAVAPTYPVIYPPVINTDSSVVIDTDVTEPSAELQSTVTDNPVSTEEETVIVVQRADGSEISSSSVDLATIQACLEQAALNCTPGQVIEVRLGPNQVYRCIIQAASSFPKNQPVQNQSLVNTGQQLYSPSYYVELPEPERFIPQGKPSKDEEGVFVQNS